MKAISIRQPWAWMIIHAGKDIENRTWKTNYRGEVFVHAGKLWDDFIRVGTKKLDPFLLEFTLNNYGISIDDLRSWAGAHGERRLGDIFQLGGIIGKVEIVDCVQKHPSKWGIDGQWHWVLANPQPLPFQRCKGQLKFFSVSK